MEKDCNRGEPKYGAVDCEHFDDSGNLFFASKINVSEQRSGGNNLCCEEKVLPAAPLDTLLMLSNTHDKVRP